MVHKASRARKGGAEAAPPSAEDAGGHGTPETPDYDDGLTTYEREREANIARNLERMAALNLPTLAQDVGTAAPAPKRGLVASRKRKSPVERSLPARKSLRGQGLAPDGSFIVDERPDGTLLLGSGEVHVVADPPPRTRPSGPLSFSSGEGKGVSDAAYLATLRNGVPVRDARPLAAQLARCKLAGERVAKLTAKGTTHLAFQPRSDALIIAAGDKEGAIGLWQVDLPAVEEGAEDPSICVLRPHSQYISGLRWCPVDATRLITCSYDGSVRALDAPTATWVEVHASAEEEFSAFDARADGACYVADNRGGVRLVDPRAGVVSATWSAHDKRANTVHVEPGAGLKLATSCGDASVCVWDVRALGGKKGPLSTLRHGKSCQAAYFAPDGSERLLTTSYDDSLTVWRPDGSKAASVKHDNQTGRWLLPLRAIWAPSGDAIVCGSMKRETEVIDAASGRHLAKLTSPEHMTAVPSRHACHPCMPAMAAATASGRVHVWRL